MPAAPPLEREPSDSTSAGPPVPYQPGGDRDRVTLTGIAAIGHHGVFDFERERGQRFVVDLTCSLDLGPAAGTDDLTLTVDYGALAQAVVADIQGDPLNLIEALADRIARTCLSYEAVNYPGFFLRSRAGQMVLEPRQEADAWKLDASFCERPALGSDAGTGSGAVSLQSSNLPGSYVTNVGGAVALVAVGAEVGGHVHALGPDLLRGPHHPVHRVAAHHAHGHVLPERAEAGDQVGAARRAGRPPERGIEHEQRQHGAVLGAGVECRVVAHPQVAAEPQKDGRHGDLQEGCEGTRAPES